MKKNIYLAAVLALSSIGFVACSDDDDNKGPNPDNPKISEGLFVLNQGNMRSKIDGSLSYIDFATQQASQEVFFKANNRKIGDTPQGAVVYGSKIYIGVYQSNTIEILNRKTLKAEITISLTGAEGQSPRALIAKDGNVYISMYNGYVSRLDTLSLSIDKTVQVGMNPEMMAIHGNDLYVPNSEGMSYNTTGYGTTATRIDLATFTAAETFTVPLNPCQFMSNGKDLFLLAKGNYGDVKSKIYKMESDKSFSEIAEATIADIHGNDIYFINSVWGAPSVEYSVYDTRNNTKSDMLKDASGIDSPATLGVDPVTGKIYITSYSKDGANVSYSIPGYCNEYDVQGNFTRKYNVGVGPAAIFFNYE